MSQEQTQPQTQAATQLAAPAESEPRSEAVTSPCSDGAEIPRSVGEAALLTGQDSTPTAQPESPGPPKSPRSASGWVNLPLYSELLFAAHHVPLLGDILSADYDPTLPFSLAPLLEMDQDFVDDLLETVEEFGLVNIGAWMCACTQADDLQVFYDVVCALRRSGHPELLKVLLVALNFEGAGSVSFSLEDVVKHEDELRASPDLLDATFLFAAAVEDAPTYLHLAALGPSFVARYKALSFAAATASPARGELLKLFHMDIDDLAISAATNGDVGLTSDLYYFASNKPSILGSIITSHQWGVACALVSLRLLQFEQFRHLLEGLRPDLLGEALACVAPEELDEQPSDVRLLCPHRAAKITPPVRILKRPAAQAPLHTPPASPRDAMAPPRDATATRRSPAPRGIVASQRPAAAQRSTPPRASVPPPRLLGDFVTGEDSQPQAEKPKRRHRGARHHKAAVSAQ